jgi:hypothetical protein
MIKFEGKNLITLLYKALAERGKQSGGGEATKSAKAFCAFLHTLQMSTTKVMVGLV